jgi:hypothetical protein
VCVCVCVQVHVHLEFETASRSDTCRKQAMALSLHALNKIDIGVESLSRRLSRVIASLRHRYLLVRCLSVGKHVQRSLGVLYLQGQGQGTASGATAQRQSELGLVLVEAVHDAAVQLRAALPAEPGGEGAGGGGDLREAGAGDEMGLSDALAVAWQTVEDAVQILPRNPKPGTQILLPDT